MKIKELIQALNDMFPLSLQEDYDNSGAQILFNDNEIESILLSLDINNDVIKEAIDKECNIIITHHPFFFRAIKKITTDDSKSNQIITLIENKISIHAIHTNLDNIYYDKLANILELQNKKLLIPRVKSGETSLGYGIISELSRPIQLEDFLRLASRKLELDFLIYSGELKNKISNIAVLNGSGGNLIENIISNNKVDCILTGDVGYHQVKFALDNSVTVIDAGHFGTERIFLTFLKNDIQDCLTNTLHMTDVKIYIAEKENNPFKIFKGDKGDKGER